MSDLFSLPFCNVFIWEDREEHGGAAPEGTFREGAWDGGQNLRLWGRLQGGFGGSTVLGGAGLMCGVGKSGAASLGVSRGAAVSRMEIWLLLSCYEERKESRAPSASSLMTPS